MTIGALVSKEDNIIRDLFYEVLEVGPQKVIYVGGYVEGFDESEIDVVITNDITAEVIPIINEQHDILAVSHKVLFKDKNGDAINIGSTLPTDLLNIKGQFIKPNSDQRIADLELMILEMMAI